VVSSGIDLCPRCVIPGKCPSGPMKLDGYRNDAPSMRVVPRFPHNGMARERFLTASRVSKAALDDKGAIGF